MAELGEMHYGRLEGASIAKVKDQIGEAARRWRAGETSLAVGGEGGESPEALIRRVSHSLHALLSGRAGQSILLVGHSHVNKVGLNISLNYVMTPARSPEQKIL